MSDLYDNFLGKTDEELRKELAFLKSNINSLGKYNAQLKLEVEELKREVQFLRGRQDKLLVHVDFLMQSLHRLTQIIERANKEDPSFLSRFDTNNKDDQDDIQPDPGLVDPDQDDYDNGDDNIDSQIVRALNNSTY